MACRSAILIDNFLPQEKFDLISSKVSAAPNYTNGEFADLRDDLWKQTTLMVFQRLKEIGLYQEHFMAATEIPNFSVNQFRPSNYGHGNMYGPHFDSGSYVFYIHPHWDENWEGNLKITNAVESEYRNAIHAKPNRFIWMNPTTFHDITTTSPNSEHARVTNLGFQGGYFDIDPVGVEYINIFTTD
tara:strand:+ start:130 stop:687 length:558 start_codon:yes stop_codon:yes gene_type:complete